MVIFQSLSRQSMPFYSFFARAQTQALPTNNGNNTIVALFYLRVFSTFVPQNVYTINKRYRNAYD